MQNNAYICRKFRKPMNEQPTQQQKPRRLPYGMQNWENVRLSGYYYVDKPHLVLLWRGMELAVAEVLLHRELTRLKAR